MRLKKIKIHSIHILFFQILVGCCMPSFCALSPFNNETYIRTIHDEDTGRLHLRWDDDTNLFLASSLEFDRKEAREKLNKHLQEIRAHMQKRVKRHMELELFPLSAQLVSEQHYSATQTPLPSIHSLIATLPFEHTPRNQTVTKKSKPITIIPASQTALAKPSPLEALPVKLTKNPHQSVIRYAGKRKETNLTPDECHPG